MIITAQSWRAIRLARAVFGGLADVDAERLAKGTLRETFDYDRPKTILGKLIVVGYESVWT